MFDLSQGTTFIVSLPVQDIFLGSASIVGNYGFYGPLVIFILPNEFYEVL